MQKLSRTGAYAGWCLAIALVGVIFISQVHSDHHEANTSAGGGEPAHWVAVNTARAAVEGPLHILVGGDWQGVVPQTPFIEAMQANITALQGAWTAYNDALNNATMQDALHDMKFAKAEAEAEVTRIQAEIDNLVGP